MSLPQSPQEGSSPLTPDLTPGTGDVKNAPGMNTERLLGWLVAYRLNMHNMIVLPQLVVTGWRERGWTATHPQRDNYDQLTPAGLAITDLNAAEYGTSFQDAPPPKV